MVWVGEQLLTYGKKSPELRKWVKGAVPRKTEVSAKSCFLSHLLLEQKVVIFQIKTKQNKERKKVM